MNVALLIELLKKMPQDAVVLTMAPDEEFYEADEPEVEQMHVLDPAVFGIGSYGDHDDKDCGLCKDGKYKIVTVVKV